MNRELEAFVMALLRELDERILHRQVDLMPPSELLAAVRNSVEAAYQQGRAPF